MSVIIAYQVTPVALTSEQRKRGMVKLGEQIRLKTDTAKNATEYAKCLNDALKVLIRLR